MLLHALEYRHPGSVVLTVNGRIDLGAGPLLRDLQVELQEGMFSTLYATYLRPWFAGTMIGDLDTAGQLNGELHWQAGELGRVKLDLADLSLHDHEGRFDLTGVNGRLALVRRREPRKSPSCTGRAAVSTGSSWAVRTCWLKRLGSESQVAGAGPHPGA